MSHVPRLLFPVEVTIVPIDKASTEYNRLAREPVRQVARSPAITIEAQVSWTNLNRPNVERRGVEEKTSGYLVLRVVDLEEQGYTPVRGDRVTSIPGVIGDFYLTTFEPCATRGGAHTLLVAYFEDRQPTRGSS